MAEKRAAFSLRRRRSLGFSKCRWLRTVFKVPSRSIFFFSRRRALSTDSPFLSFISVKLFSLPLQRPLKQAIQAAMLLSGQTQKSISSQRVVNGQSFEDRHIVTKTLHIFFAPSRLFPLVRH